LKKYSSDLFVAEKEIKEKKNKKKKVRRRKKEENLTKYQFNLLCVVSPASIPFCLVLCSPFHCPLGSAGSVSGEEGTSELSVPGSLQGGRLWWWLWYSSSSSC